MPKKGNFDKLKAKLARRYYRINQFIQANKIRAIDEKGKQIGIMALGEALKQAQEKRLDLVEIAAKAQPPVCKIINFKKFLFQEEKKEKDSKKKSKKVDLKQIRLRPFIAENDLNFRLKQAERFLKTGNKVKIIIRFLGREITKKDFGYELLKKSIEKLKPVSEIETEPKFFGNQLEINLNPAKKDKNVEKK